ncbi:hypothetical protein GOODEAATRI_020331 [Goodea atripinnis]|uniref:Natural killer-tumor recognition protein n=1 Tax=Goodea atripinnis TaxID=208336 RepID=A0ABV0NC68_9TELE
MDNPPCGMQRAAADDRPVGLKSWAVPVPSAELNLVSLTGLGVAPDPSSDWNAPSEAWGNYEEPTSEPPQAEKLPLPEPAKVNLIGAAEDNEDDKDKGDATTDGAAKTKKKKKKKKKTPEEGGTLGQVRIKTEHEWQL